MHILKNDAKRYFGSNFSIFQGEAWDASRHSTERSALNKAEIQKGETNQENHKLIFEMTANLAYPLSIAIQRHELVLDETIQGQRYYSDLFEAYQTCDAWHRRQFFKQPYRRCQSHRLEFVFP